MRRIALTAILTLLATLLLAQWHIDEDFEQSTTLPDGWSVIDDGDGMTWRNLSHDNAHSGSRAAFVDNYLPNQNADWLITPQINIANGDSLSFYTRAWVGTEELQVYVSTTGTAASNFSTHLITTHGIGTAYQQVNVSLQQFAGQNVYLGFYWECSNYGILVDDVKIGQILNIEPALNLPDEISFFADAILSLDFSEYIVCTNPEMAALSVEDNDEFEISINGFIVNISSNDFIGSSNAIFTLEDLITGQSASDTLQLNVLEVPSVDLSINEVLSPRNFEYQNIPLTPRIVVSNEGSAVFSNQLEVQLQVLDTDTELVHSDIATMDVQIEPMGSIELSFPNTYTPLQEGLFSFIFSIITVDDYMDNNSHSANCSVVNRITSGGPDAFGYRYLDSNDPIGPDYEWLEINQSGTSTVLYNVPSWGGDDNFSEPIPLGFDFPFYGTTYTSAYVDINGEILLADNSWQNPYPGQNWDYDGNMFNYMYPIPGYAQMPALIAVYWDDLHADEGTANVYFQSFGTAPERYTVVQWENLRFHAGNDPQQLLKFQVILHENGNIKMQYHTVATEQTGASIPHDHGRSSTIAIQNEAADAGLLYLRELVQNNTYVGVEPAGNLLHDELAILFFGGEDTQAPILAHDEVGNCFSQELEIVASIADMSSLIDASVHYNYGSGWQSVQSSSISGLDYSFILQNLPLGASVEYYISAEDEHGNIATLPASAPEENYSFRILPTTDARILLMYSGNQDYQRNELPVYTSILDELNIAYDVYDWEEYSSYAIPAQYEGVLVYATTGSANDKAYYLAEILSNYLDLGTTSDIKNLWFASDGWASSQHAHPNSSTIRRLMSGYFRTSYVATGFGGGSNGLGGPDNYSYEHGSILALPLTPVGTANTEYAVYANSPDCIFPNNAAGDPYYDDVPYPEIGANYVYAFEDGPINNQAYLYHGVAATTVETPSYRTLYFSFDFSQLSQETDRLEWMEDLMAWWDISPTAIIDAELPTATIGINSIYPNPFNPHTNIRFQLPAASMARLAIYNLRGQLVKELMNNELSAGSHTAVWDGKDADGKAVAGGIYFVRLTSEGHSDSRKITMIK